MNQDLVKKSLSEDISKKQIVNITRAFTKSVKIAQNFHIYK